MLEPGIGGERRIKRSIVYRIESAIQAKKQDLPTAKASSDKAIKACTEYAEAFKWSHQKLKENGRRAIGGESSPLAHDGAFLDLWSPRSDLAADELRRRAALDAAMWRYASAVAHGTAYAIIESLGSPPPSAAQSTMLNPAMVEKGFVASTDRVQTLGSMMALAAIEVVRRRDVLMGWDAPTEQRDAEERLRNLAVAVAKRKNGRA